MAYFKYLWQERQDERREDRRPKPVKKRHRIMPATKKRAKQNREYQIVRIQYLIDHPVCEARIKCHGNTTKQVHHKAGRIEYLLTDTNNFLAVCSDCHRHIENNPVEAKELGLSLNRIN